MHGPPTHDTPATHPSATAAHATRRQTHTLCTGRLSSGVSRATTAPPHDRPSLRPRVTYHPTRQQPLSASHSLSRPPPASSLDLAHEDGRSRLVGPDLLELERPAGKKDASSPPTRAELTSTRSCGGSQSAA